MDAESYESLLENFPGAAFVTDPEEIHAPLVVVGELADLVGGLVDHPSGLSLHALREAITAGEREQVVSAIASATAQGKPWRVAYSFNIRGRLTWIEEEGRPLGGPRGKWGIFLRDIGNRVRQLTDVQAALAEARRQLQWKNDYFASVSHEIRTPMNGVIGIAQVLAKTQLNSEQRQYLSTILDSGRSLLNIINDILDLSKLEAGRLELNIEEIDLEKIAYDVCQLMSSRAVEKNLQIVLNYPQTFPRTVQADGGRLRQVLVNLVGNAIKFTADGHVMLTVECRKITATRAYFIFKIADTGIGISQDVQDRLFSAYTQADAAVAQQYGGTGLGLQICKQLVELMGGAIGVISEPGRGSTFWFCSEFPIVSSTRGLTALNLAGKSAVVVSRHAVARAVTGDYLRDAGAAVTSIGDAEDALAHLSTDKHYDLAIIDRDLGVLDGVKLTQLVKSSATHRNMAVVLLTSILDRVDPAELFSAGINAYLRQPVSCNMLYHALAAVLENPAGGKEAIFVSNENLQDSNTNTSTFVVKGTALVAEDQDVNRVVLQALLSHVGLVVDFAENGERAIQKWSTGKYDVIFMDCRMPVMDGYSATREIRSAASEGSRVPIIALTANASEEDKQRCLQSGMDDYLAKPFTEPALQNALKRWLPHAVTEIAGPALHTYQLATGEHIVLDEDQFHKLKALMKEKFDEFVVSLLDRFQERYGTLQAAINTGALNDAREVSHAIKGLAGMIGAKRVFDLCGIIEQASKEEDFAKATMHMSKLESALDNAASAIRKELHVELDQPVVLF